jgi:hypothetical protein
MKQTGVRGQDSFCITVSIRPPYPRGESGSPAPGHRISRLVLNAGRRRSAGAASIGPPEIDAGEILDVRAMTSFAVEWDILTRRVLTDQFDVV